MCKCTPAGHEVHPQAEQESILGQFLLGGLDLEVSATTKKGSQLFWQKSAPPDKIQCSGMKENSRSSVLRLHGWTIETEQWKGVCLDHGRHSITDRRTHPQRSGGGDASNFVPPKYDHDLEVAFSYAFITDFYTAAKKL